MREDFFTYNRILTCILHAYVIYGEKKREGYIDRDRERERERERERKKEKERKRKRERGEKEGDWVNHIF